MIGFPVRKEKTKRMENKKRKRGDRKGCEGDKNTKERKRNDRTEMRRRFVMVIVRNEDESWEHVYKIPSNEFTNVDYHAIQELVSLGYTEVSEGFSHLHLKLRMGDPFVELQYETWFNEVFGETSEKIGFSDWRKYSTTFDDISWEYIGDEYAPSRDCPPTNPVFEEVYFIDT